MSVRLKKDQKYLGNFYLNGFKELMAYSELISKETSFGLPSRTLTFSSARK